MEISWFWIGVGLFVGWGIEWIIDMRYWRGLGTRPPGDNAFKADLSALRIRFDDAVAKLADSDKEIEALRAQLREGLSEDALDLHEQLQRANAEIATLRATNSDQPADNSQLVSELAEAKAMIERLQSENNTSPLIALNELQAKLDEAESELAGYRSVEEISRIELQELRQKLAEAESKSAPKGKAGEEIAALKRQLEEKDSEIQRLKATPPPVVDGFSGDFETLRSKANQAEYFAKQLEAARQTIATLEMEMLNQPVQSVASAPPVVDTAALDDLNAKNAELQTELLRMRTGYENAVQDAELLQRRVSELERFDRDTVSLEDFNDVRTKLNEAEAQISALTQDRQHGTQELESLRKQLESSSKTGDDATSMRQEIEELSAKLASRDQMVTEFRSEMNALSAKLHTSQAELEDLRAARNARDNEAQSLKDEIENLKADAAKFKDLEKRLQNAEIELEAYNDLKLAKEQLQDRLGLLEGELIEARSKQDEIDMLKAQIAQAQQANQEMAQLRAHLDHHRTALAATLAQLDTLSGGVQAPPPVPAFIAPPPITQKDSFTKIEGIDLVAERKLWDAGYLTYSDLAQANPDQVGLIVSPDEWMNVEAEAWIAEAKRLAGA